MTSLGNHYTTKSSFHGLLSWSIVERLKNALNFFGARISVFTAPFLVYFFFLYIFFMMALSLGTCWAFLVWSGDACAQAEAGECQDPGEAKAYCNSHEWKWVDVPDQCQFHYMPPSEVKGLLKGKRACVVVQERSARWWGQFCRGVCRHVGMCCRRRAYVVQRCTAPFSEEESPRGGEGGGGFTTVQVE